MEPNCVCGHTEDEHGGDGLFSRSTKCAVEDCDCLVFDKDEGEEDGSK